MDMADYLSRLPESLIHHIFSFLPSKETCRTCVLSKYFNSIWSNYPNLDFYFSDPYPRVKKTDEDFFDRMENSLGRCLVRRSFIQQLNLNISCFRANGLITKLDDWLSQSIDKNVSRLVLSLYLLQERQQICYSVPHQVLVARTLEVLDLSWCTLDEHRIIHVELPLLEKLSLSHCQLVGENLLQKILCASRKIKHISLSLLDLSRCIFKEDSFVRIELPCLEKLLLCNCRFIGDNLLQKILCASPKMKHISLEHCKGLGNSLFVSCPPLLKYFLLRCGHEFERIKIDAPSLHTFSYGCHNAACAIDLTTCTNLKELNAYNYGVGTVLLRNLRISLCETKQGWGFGW